MKFDLTIQCQSDVNDRISMHSIDVIEGKSFVELLSKFILLVAVIQNRVNEQIEMNRRSNEVSDDIPF